MDDFETMEDFRNAKSQKRTTNNSPLFKKPSNRHGSEDDLVYIKKEFPDSADELAMERRDSPDDPHLKKNTKRKYTEEIPTKKVNNTDAQEYEPIIRQLEEELEELKQQAKEQRQQIEALSNENEEIYARLQGVTSSVTSKKSNGKTSSPSPPPPPANGEMAVLVKDLAGKLKNLSDEMKEVHSKVSKILETAADTTTKNIPPKNVSITPKPKKPTSQVSSEGNPLPTHDELPPDQSIPNPGTPGTQDQTSPLTEDPTDSHSLPTDASNSQPQTTTTTKKAVSRKKV